MRYFKCAEEALAATLEKVVDLFSYLTNDKLKEIKAEVLSILKKAKSDIHGTVKSANALHKKALDAAKSSTVDASEQLNNKICLLGGRREPLDHVKTFRDAKRVLLDVGQIFQTLSAGALYVERNNVLGNLELAYRLYEGPDIPLRHVESTTIHSFVHAWFSINSESYCKKYQLSTPLTCAYCGKELSRSKAVGAHAMLRQKGCVYVMIIPVCNKCNHHKNQKQFPNFNLHVQGVLLMKIKQNAIAYAADTFIQVKKKETAGGKISHFHSALITSNSVTFNGRTKRGVDIRFTSKDLDGFLAAMICSMMNLNELPMKVTELGSERLITISKSGKIIRQP